MPASLVFIAGLILLLSQALVLLGQVRLAHALVILGKHLVRRPVMRITPEGFL